ncbi:putative cytochrome P450 monooxygenase [Xylariomycetidae sp. FL0641]|nr:putative cytochrome P450 monooxygenase [Xylariomycetidae sp. FL0641]
MASSDTLARYERPAHIAAVALGICLHQGYFRHGEHSSRSAFYLLTAVSTLLSSTATLSIIGDMALMPSAIWSASTFGYLLLGLYGSLLCYRVAGHPLNRFPGPFAARFGDIWLTVKARGYDWHKKSMELYETYGPFVRIGSSTLMIMDPLGVPAMYGPQSKCQRAEWYAIFGAPYGIISRAPGVHRDRRRIWSQAFKDEALRNYEPRIRAYAAMFLEGLETAAENAAPIDMARWCTSLAWDIVGDLGLDQDFALMKTGHHWAHGLVIAWTRAMGARLPPWLVSLLQLVPGSGRAVKQWEAFCNKQVDAVIANKSGNKCSNITGIMASYLPPSPSQEDIRHLQSDCKSAIFAGSDTTASSLAFIFYHLAKSPEHIQKLRDGLAPLKNQDGSFSNQKIQQSEHLNAVCNEALRLWPPGTVIPRQTPAEGIMVGETFIPGDVTVIGSQWVLGHSAEVYERPLEFIPERWYSQPELIKERAGYAPFNIGPHSCVGRPLAMMVLRTLVAEVVIRFDVHLPEGDDGAEFEKGVEESHVWRIPELNMYITPRK